MHFANFIVFIFLTKSSGFVKHLFGSFLISEFDLLWTYMCIIFQNNSRIKINPKQIKKKSVIDISIKHIIFRVYFIKCIFVALFIGESLRSPLC